MNNITPFLTKQNIQILWDVLLDELRIDTNNKQIVSNIRIVFESNITPFISKAPQNVSLVDLNKQFLSQLVIAVNRLFPALKQEQELKRIHISSEEVEIQEPYKIEDILTARQNNFEKQVKQKQQEFDNSIHLQRPPELDFSEKVDDGKIKEMDALIAETIARRKFEVEQYKPILNTSINTSSNSNILETEQTHDLNPTHRQETDKKNVNQHKKKVSWTETKLTNNNDSIINETNFMLNEKQESLAPISVITSSNLFNKIKKINSPNEIGSEFKLTKPLLAPIISNNDLNELNRKYDLLNKKMDLLIDLVNKLTNQFEKKVYEKSNIENIENLDI